MATVRATITGGPNTTITPIADDPHNAGKPGTVVLRKRLDGLYVPVVYVAGAQGATTVNLPAEDLVVLDLPGGMFTPKSEINDALNAHVAGSHPPGVGPT